jgi:hypothetical protein
MHETKWSHSRLWMPVLALATAAENPYVQGSAVTAAHRTFMMPRVMVSSTPAVVAALQTVSA